MYEAYAKINNIIDMSVVDGPGNRTSIFFQGCQMDCIYCHNPETIARFNETMAYSIADTNTVKHNNEILLYDVDTLVKRVLKNVPFIRGVTVSGGECTLQHKFLTAFFKALKSYKLTTFVDTNGVVALKSLTEFIEVCDAFMLDIKAFDEEQHREITSIGNTIVLENACFLAELGKLYEIRTVCIDGLDNKKTVSKITEMLKPYLAKNDIRYKIIRYQPYGVREAFSHYVAPDKQALLELLSIAKNNGFINATIV